MVFKVQPIMREVFQAIVGGARSLPGRVGHNALVSAFALEMIEARLRWLELADALVAEWPDTRAGDDKEAQGIACYARMVERIDALLGASKARSD